jgi:hypothetical protein
MENASTMKAFLRDRGPGLALIVVIMSLIAISHSGISSSFVLGRLRNHLPTAAPLIVSVLLALQMALLTLAVVLWTLNRRRALFNVIVIANTFFTVMLLLYTTILMAVLAGLSSRSADALIADVALIAVSNILIFSIWYWIIDPPGIVEGRDEDWQWAFLFPQRASALPHCDAWVPHYVDYVFIAFTTSFAFSPTDTLPLTRNAKMLMLLQSTISVVTLTGIAGSAINILAGGS